MQFYCVTSLIPCQLAADVLSSLQRMKDYGVNLICVEDGIDSSKDAGKVSAEIAKLHAETEFEKYRVIQDRLFMSDFDKYLQELEENAKK